MKKYLAPLAGAVLVWVGFATMPEITAQGATVPIDAEVPPTLLAIPILGEFLVRFSKWLPVVFQVVGMFAMVASLTKNETDDKVIGYILKGINLLGFNIGAAKNDPAVK